MTGTLCLFFERMFENDYDRSWEWSSGVFGVLWVCKLFFAFLIFFLFSRSLYFIGGAILNRWGERKD